MSARRRQLVIRPDAREDLRQILIYTQERWGAEQRRRYRALMYQAMRSLLDYPERGRTREEYFPDCRGLPAEHHIIFYRLTDDEVVIVRILHGNQDAAGKVRP
jgi:toxin ParE1/3/4